MQSTWSCSPPEGCAVQVNECGPVYMLVGNGGQSIVPAFIDTQPQSAACNDSSKVTRGQETYLPNAKLCITQQVISSCHMLRLEARAVA